ncbi:unnamed protein product, partial [Symbiodinium sp. KB8]
LSSKDVDGTLHFPVGEAAGTVARSACKLSALLGCASLASAVFRNDTVKDFNRTSTDLGHSYVNDKDVLGFLMEQCAGGTNVLTLNTFKEGRALAQTLCAPAADTLGARVGGMMQSRHPWASANADNVTPSSSLAPWVPRSGVVYIGAWTGVLVLISAFFTLQSVGCLCCARKPTEVTVSTSAEGRVTTEQHTRCFNWTRFVTGTTLAITLALLAVNVYYGFQAAALGESFLSCKDISEKVYSQYLPGSNCTEQTPFTSVGAVPAECAVQAAHETASLVSVAQYYAPSPNCIFDPEGEGLDALAASFLTSVAVWGAGIGLGFVSLAIFTFTAAAFDSTEEVVAAVWGSPDPHQDTMGNPYGATQPLTTGAGHSSVSYT